VTLACGHAKEVKCVKSKDRDYLAYESENCVKPVQFTRECGHFDIIQCFATYENNLKDIKVLEEGKAPEFLTKCNKPCAGVCSVGHSCEKKCNSEAKCDHKCTFTITEYDQIGFSFLFLENVQEIYIQ
jgi:hypothetical protein